MRVYRISTKTFINDLNGDGARLYGGRWNLKGSSVIYTSESRALASLEYLVHVPIQLLPNDLRIATIEIDDKISPEKLNTGELPSNWKDFPSPGILAEIGTNWTYENKSLLLIVPSALVYDEYNILINPSHPDIKHVRISEVKEFFYDKRLLK